MVKKGKRPPVPPPRKPRKGKANLILVIFALLAAGYMYAGYFIPGVPLWMKKGFPVLPSNPGWEENVEAWMNDPKKAIHDWTLWETLPDTQP